MAVIKFYVLSSGVGLAAAPNWWSILQRDGTAPTAGNTIFGWGPVKIAVTTPYFRGRMGANASNQTTAQASSYNASTSGPTPGTSNTVTTSGDCFVTPAPLTGTFAATAWTFDWMLRATNAGAIGHINMRVWKSVNANGSGATQLLANTAGATVTLATASDVNSSISWSPGALTLNGEYLFFQMEWQETVAGTSNSDNVQFRAGTAIITTPDFAEIIPFTFVPYVDSPPAIAAGVLTQRHVLPAPSAAAAGSPVFAAPALTQAAPVSDIPAAIALVAGKPGIDAASGLTQSHKLTASALTVQPYVVGVAVLSIQAIPLAANDLAATAPTFGTPALLPIVLLSASNLATAPPVEAAATISQVHALGANALASSSPAFTVPTFNKTVAAVAAPLTVSSPTVDAAAFAQPHTLSAIALVTTSPVLDVVIVSQAGSMAALPLVTTPPTLGVGTLTQKQVLAASTTTTSSPSIASATLIQQQRLSPTSVVTASPSVGVTALGQQQVLSATPLAVLVPTIAAATLSQAGVMACIPIAVTSPVIGAPAVGQKHVAVALSLATGAPALGAPALGKVLSAAALTVSAPVLGAPALTKVLAAAPLSLSTPVIGVPAFALRVFDLAATALAIGPPTLPALTIGQSGVLPRPGSPLGRRCWVPPPLGSTLLQAPPRSLWVRRASGWLPWARDTS
jgi:hypothetical protein